MRHPLLIVLLATALAAGCAKKDQPAETGTMGNATDRNPANGTSGTGEPASVATDATNAAQQRVRFFERIGSAFQSEVE